MKKLLPGAAAVVLAVAMSSFMANGGFALFRGAPTDAEIDQLLIDSGVDQTYAALQTYFPEDAAKWRRDLADLVEQRRKGLYVTTNAIDVGSELRRKHAAALATTSDLLLVKVMEQQSRLYQIFENDVDACNRFLIDGAYGLERDERQMLGPVLNDGAILFEAMHNGLNEPVTRGASTENDWMQLFEVMIGKGAKNEDIDLIANPDPDNPRLCPAFLMFIHTLADAEFDGADRVRAEMAVAFISA